MTQTQTKENCKYLRKSDGELDIGNGTTRIVASMFNMSFVMKLAVSEFVRSWIDGAGWLLSSCRYTVCASGKQKHVFVLIQAPV